MTNSELRVGDFIQWRDQGETYRGYVDALSYNPNLNQERVTSSCYSIPTENVEKIVRKAV